MSRRRIAIACVVLLVSAGVAWWLLRKPPGPDTAVIQSLIASEEWILEQTPRLRKLAAGIGDPVWPGGQPAEKELLAQTVFVNDLQPMPEWRVITDYAVERANWVGTPEDREQPAANWNWWNPLRSRTAKFRSFKFGFVNATAPTAEAEPRVTADLYCEGLLETDDGKLISADGKLTSGWVQSGGQWRLRSLQVKQLAVVRSAGMLFTEVLETAIPDPAQRRAARISMQQQILKQYYLPDKPLAIPDTYRDNRFYADSVNIHPGLAVVDIDTDGWDDFYVCVDWGRNMLFRNRGDGTFEECAAKFGLDVEGRSNCALFADYDNDGDADVIVGRSLDYSKAFQNNGGRFEEKTAGFFPGGAPGLVTAISAADYNNDGLLDIYVCTYSPLDYASRITGQGGMERPEDWMAAYLSKDEAAEYRRRAAAQSHTFLHRVGPPNRLYVNKGGSFAVAPESTQVACWRDSFQGSWCDYDQDGDADLFVANDFSRGMLFRNDRDKGFADVTESAGMGAMGYAMGAAWADYDQDGRPDLYLSNMFSKAGRRITVQVPGLDPRFNAVAQGNFLFRNLGDGTFTNVAGLEPPALAVAKVGWSWGGQFADFDNDSWEDLYVPSGYYTAPDDVAVDMDL